MQQSEIQFVGDLQRLELKAGDRLVLKTARPISNDTCERLRQYLEEQFPGHKCLVLGDGLELGIISATIDAEAT